MKASMDSCLVWRACADMRGNSPQTLSTQVYVFNSDSKKWEALFHVIMCTIKRFLMNTNM